MTTTNVAAPKNLNSIVAEQQKAAKPGDSAGAAQAAAGVKKIVTEYDRTQLGTNKPTTLAQKAIVPDNKSAASVAGVSQDDVRTVMTSLGITKDKQTEAFLWGAKKDPNGTPPVTDSNSFFVEIRPAGQPEAGPKSQWILNTPNRAYYENLNAPPLSAEEQAAQTEKIQAAAAKACLNGNASQDTLLEAVGQTIGSYGVNPLAFAKFMKDGDATGLRADFARLYYAPVDKERVPPEFAQLFKDSNGAEPSQLRMMLFEAINKATPPDQDANCNPITDADKVARNKKSNLATTDYAYSKIIEGLATKNKPGTDERWIQIRGLPVLPTDQDRADRVQGEMEKIWKFADKQQAKLDALAKQYPDYAKELSGASLYLQPIMEGGKLKLRTIETPFGESQLPDFEVAPEFTKLMSEVHKTTDKSIPPEWTKENKFQFGLGKETWNQKMKIFDEAIANAKPGDVIYYHTWQHYGDSPEQTKVYSDEMNKRLIKAHNEGMDVRVLVNGQVSTRSQFEGGSEDHLKPLEKAGLKVVRYGTTTQNLAPADQIAFQNAEAMFYGGNHNKLFGTLQVIQMTGQNTHQMYYEDSGKNNQWLDGGITAIGNIAESGAKSHNQVVENFVRTTIDKPYQAQMLKQLRVPEVDVPGVKGATGEGLLWTQIPRPDSRDTAAIAMMAPLAVAKGKYTVVAPYFVPMFPEAKNDPLAQNIVRRAMKGWDTEVLKNSYESSDLGDLEHISYRYSKSIMDATHKIRPQSFVVREKIGSNEKKPGDPVNNFWGTVHFKGGFEETLKLGDYVFDDAQHGLFQSYTSQPHRETLSEVEAGVLGVGDGAALAMQEQFAGLIDTHFRGYYAPESLKPPPVTQRSNALLGLYRAAGQLF